MSTAKEEVSRILEQIPDDSSFEDIQYHIYVRQKIETAFEDIRAGRTISHEEAVERMSRSLDRLDGPSPQ